MACSAVFRCLYFLIVLVCGYFCDSSVCVNYCDGLVGGGCVNVAVVVVLGVLCTSLRSMQVFGLLPLYSLFLLVVMEVVVAVVVETLILL